MISHDKDKIKNRNKEINSLRAKKIEWLTVYFFLNLLLEKFKDFIKLLGEISIEYKLQQSFICSQRTFDYLKHISNSEVTQNHVDILKNRRWCDLCFSISAYILTSFTYLFVCEENLLLWWVTHQAYTSI